VPRRFLLRRDRLPHPALRLAEIDPRFELEKKALHSAGADLTDRPSGGAPIERPLHPPDRLAVPIEAPQVTALLPFGSFDPDSKQFHRSILPGNSFQGCNGVSSAAAPVWHRRKRPSSPPCGTGIPACAPVLQHMGGTRWKACATRGWPVRSSYASSPPCGTGIPACALLPEAGAVPTFRETTSTAPDQFQKSA
jgi:hypothetical protein